MAKSNEIIEAIEALAVHCRPPLMSVEDRTRWLRGWVEDLGEYTIEAVNHACRKWRQGESAKFPTPGQLLPLVRSVAKVDNSGGKVHPWRPISDDEYRDLTVKEKIRHLQIVSHNIKGLHGPMYSMTLKRQLTPDEMPPQWHEAQASAKRIGGEIKRLREIVLSAQERAA